MLMLERRPVAWAGIAGWGGMTRGFYRASAVSAFWSGAALWYELEASTAAGRVIMRSNGEKLQRIVLKM